MYKSSHRSCSVRKSTGVFLKVCRVPGFQFLLTDTKKTTRYLLVQC